MFFLQDLVKQNLTERALDMKDQSEELLREAEDAGNDLSGNLSLHCTPIPIKPAKKRVPSHALFFVVPTKMLQRI